MYQCCEGMRKALMDNLSDCGKVLYPGKRMIMEISITINPGKLNNPDLDLRYDIPDKASELSNGDLEDNGYDYDDNNDLIIFMISSGLDETTIRSILKSVFDHYLLESEALNVEIK